MVALWMLLSVPFWIAGYVFAVCIGTRAKSPIGAVLYFISWIGMWGLGAAILAYGIFGGIT